MFSIPFYFADAQITDAFENLPIQNLYSGSQKGTERWRQPFPLAQKKMYLQNTQYLKIKLTAVRGTVNTKFQ